MRVLLRLAFAFEPLASTAISYYTTRTLRGWEKQGLISDFKTHTKRLGKIHYKVEIEVEVNPEQAHYILAHVLAKPLKTLGRWVDV
jgi:hypothetical protein